MNYAFLNQKQRLFCYLIYFSLIIVFLYLSPCATQLSALESICLPLCLVQMEQHDKGTGANPFPPCHLQAFRSATALFHLD